MNIDNHEALAETHILKVTGVYDQTTGLQTYDMGKQTVSVSRVWQCEHKLKNIIDEEQYDKYDANYLEDNVVFGSLHLQIGFGKLWVIERVAYCHSSRIV